MIQLYVVTLASAEEYVMFCQETLWGFDLRTSSTQSQATRFSDWRAEQTVDTLSRLGIRAIIKEVEKVNEEELITA